MSSCIDDLTTPCFVVDVAKVERNAESMIKRSKAWGVKLRPHMKTHKTIEGGLILTSGSKMSIVVSTVKEAEFFASGGFDDILYGTPILENKIGRCQVLANKLKSFHVMVDSPYGLDTLETNPLQNGKLWSVYVKVDCGSKRAGVVWDSPDCIDLVKRANNSNGMFFTGLYSHDSNSYLVQGKEQVGNVGNTTATRISKLAERLKQEGIDCKEFGVGSTPSCSMPGNMMKDVTEFHPGNYVFYDSWQYTIGSCTLDDIAGRVVTRIQGHYPHRNQMLVDCGFTALSFDGQDALKSGYCIIQDNPNLRFVKMTQEIGFIEPIVGALNYEAYPIGSKLFLYPWHSCATAAMFPEYYIHRGSDVIVDKWIPTRGW